MLYTIFMSISFFANYLSLAIYFMFILDYRNNIRQKANLSDFLIRVQNGSESSGDNLQHQQHIWPRNC